MLPALVSLAGAFAPVIMERSKTEAQLAVADRDANVKLLTTVLGQKPADPMAGITQLLAVIAPIAVPMLTEMWKNNSPKAHAEMLAVEHDQRMAQLTMMAEMVKSLIPDPPPAWQPLIEMGVSMIGQHMASRQLMQSSQQRALPQGQPQQQLPRAPAAGQPQPMAVPQATAVQAPVDFDTFASLDPAAAQITQLVSAARRRQPKRQLSGMQPVTRGFLLHWAQVLATM